ncbi:MAG: succinate dehydrogenase/fumarate reductase iron-sulfur subunit [Myxococcales bacterium]|nr:succinate dehydrogenase/fumarate reductase iron-sulfur subunit [Myxococcales bacterium]
MTITLRVWRQRGPEAEGAFEDHVLHGLSPHMSVLDALDMLNERLVGEGQAPVGFDHDCREGICGSCGAMVNGVAHGPVSETTLCQLHLRHFGDSDVLVLEPFRVGAFPVVRDLIVDRSALDRIIGAGGYISVRTGAAPEASTTPVRKDAADRAFSMAACIGCGACAAACPNASAMLFTAAKVAHLASLPQGQPEANERVKSMVAAIDTEGFGGCSNHGECAAVCPKGIDLSAIATLNREYLRAQLAES